MAIYVTGDTHGSRKFRPYSVDGFMHRFNTENFPEQKHLTKDDFVIICGDFGGVWNTSGESAEEKYALNWLDEKPFTTLFVPGNHENYDRLIGLNEPALVDSWMYKGLSKETKNRIVAGYPRKAWHNGFVREIRPSILMLERGYVYMIDGHKCFAFGGAESHDISDGIIPAENFSSEKALKKEIEKWKDIQHKYMFRINHISWWQQEMPSQMEMEKGWAMLEDENYIVDFIFSHDAPSSLVKLLNPKFVLNPLNDYLEEVKQKVKYKNWFFGHYHANHTFPDNKNHVLYEQIIRIV